MRNRIFRLICSADPVQRIFVRGHRSSRIHRHGLHAPRIVSVNICGFALFIGPGDRSLTANNNAEEERPVTDDGRAVQVQPRPYRVHVALTLGTTAVLVPSLPPSRLDETASPPPRT
jgi:hypothetical protein